VVAIETYTLLTPRRTDLLEALEEDRQPGERLLGEKR
jgi:hypothetical protein